MNLTMSSWLFIRRNGNFKCWHVVGPSPPSHKVPPFGSGTESDKIQEEDFHNNHHASFGIRAIPLRAFGKILLWTTSATNTTTACIIFMAVLTEVRTWTPTCAWLRTLELTRQRGAARKQLLIQSAVRGFNRKRREKKRKCWLNIRRRVRAFLS